MVQNDIQHPCTTVTSPPIVQQVLKIIETMMKSHVQLFIHVH